MPTGSLSSRQPNFPISPLAIRLNFALASASWSNDAFLSLRLMAVAQASNSVRTTRRMAVAVCSLRNVSPESSAHSSVSSKI